MIRFLELLEARDLLGKTMVGQLKSYKMNLCYYAITLITLTRQLSQISVGEMFRCTAFCAESQVHKACVDILRCISNC